MPSKGASVTESVLLLAGHGQLRTAHADQGDLLIDAVEGRFEAGFRHALGRLALLQLLVGDELLHHELLGPIDTVAGFLHQRLFLQHGRRLHGDPAAVQVVRSQTQRGAGLLQLGLNLLHAQVEVVRVQGRR